MPPKSKTVFPRPLESAHRIVYSDDAVFFVPAVRVSDEAQGLALYGRIYLDIEIRPPLSAGHIGSHELGGS